jgi:hypothetical protein
MKAKNLKNYETTQKDTKGDTLSKLEDFYKDNLRKIYYLSTNIYDETEGRNYKHTNPTVKNIKRVSYFSIDPLNEDETPRTNWRKNIDRIIIDCDEGIAKCLPVIQPILDTLDCEYWVIAGTDKENKPKDSGSIVIMFKPIEGITIRKKFQSLVRCLNIHLGDVRNIGYMHKNPLWEKVHTFSKYGNNIPSFNELYNIIFDYFNISYDDVNIIYDNMVKDAYTKDLIDELSKEHPKRSRALSLYYRTHRDSNLKLQLDNLMLSDNKDILSPKQYAKYLLIHEYYFENPKYNKIIIKPLDLITKYGISEKQEAYIYKKVRQNFNVFKISDNELRLLGFSDDQMSKLT